MNKIADWLVGSLGYLALVAGCGLLACYAAFSVLARFDDVTKPMDRHWLAIGIALVLSGYVASVALARLNARLQALENKQRSDDYT